MKELVLLIGGILFVGILWWLCYLLYCSAPALVLAIAVIGLLIVLTLTLGKQGGL